jgi:hypothetical protein
MRFRKLRIAFSAVCAITCLLVIMLWARSYNWMDSGRVICLVRTMSFNSFNGRLALSSLSGDGTFGARAYSTPRNHIKQKWMYEDSRGFVFLKPKVVLLILPHWSFVVLFATLVVGPWIGHLRWRFSLRILLIATTLVALALTVIAFAMRK